MARYNKSPVVVAALVKAGANPKARNEKGDTPLHRAAAHNRNPVVVAALVKAGANPNAQAENGATPLHYAAAHNRNPVVIAALVKAGADPKAQAKTGDTPLHGAALRGLDSAVFRALVKAGGDPRARNEKGETPAVFARRIKKETASDCDKLCDESFWKTATAASVRAEIARGANPNARNEKGATPLYEATRYNQNPAAIEALLKAGAVVKAKARDFAPGNTPLHFAARYNKNPAVAVALLEGGADVNVRSAALGGSLLRAAFTPLHRAASNNNPAVVAALLKAGADPNARSQNDSTPLHGAKSPAVIEALLEAGADPNVRYRNDSPLDSAYLFRKVHPAVYKALSRKAKAIRTARSEAEARIIASRGPLKIYYSVPYGQVGHHMTVGAPRSKCRVKWTARHPTLAGGSLPPGLRLRGFRIEGTPQRPGTWRATLKFTKIDCGDKRHPDENVDVHFNIRGLAPRRVN